MKAILKALLLGLASVLLVLLLHTMGMPLLRMMELSAIDLLFQARGPTPARSRMITLVAVDERSLDQEGRWPWPREKLAKLVDAVLGAGALSLGLDMGFFEPENRLPASAALEIAKQANQGKVWKREEILARFQPDQVLARAFARHRDQLVMGFFFHMSRREVAHLDPKEINRRIRMVSPLSYKLVRFSSQTAADLPLLRAFTPEPNQEVLSKAAAWGGFFNSLPDADGVIRRLPLVIKCQDRYFPSLALVTLCRAAGLPLPPLAITEAGMEPVRLGPISIPVDPIGRMFINFRGGVDAIQTVSATDVLRDPGKARELAGKVVILGVTAAGILDHRPTPFDRHLAGSMIHAQAMDNILSGDFLVRTLWTDLIDFLAIIFLGLLAALLVSTFRPLVGGALTILAAAGFLALVYHTFTRGYLLSSAHPLLSLALSGMLVTVYYYLVETRQRRYIRRAFQYYLSPAVIDTLIKDPKVLKLGGSKQDITVLFSDIRDFTSLSESLPPERLSQLLNVYMDRMTAIVFQEQGVLDKYIGDAVMAFWGAPVPQPDQAERACRTALAMVEALALMGPDWEKLSAPPLRIGIGIHSGPMVVGNMGSSQRFDYTVIGDNVNLGSRLEGQTKAYGVQIVVSQATRELCRSKFHFRVLDLVRVKGKNKPVSIYELAAPATQPEPAFVARAAVAMGHYANRRFREAAREWEANLAENPADKASGILLERCRLLQKEPPPPDWDGSVTKSEK